MLSSLLAEYDFTKHVASDIGIDEHYVPPKSLKTQADLETISEWTDKNLMKLNTCKTKYMIFSRSETEIATRLAIKGQTIDRIEETKLVGVWLTTWLDWDKNTREICKKAYARMTMLTKLKYVGVDTADLIHIYIHVRSHVEYCSVVWHSTLTKQQIDYIENIQKLSLKIILGQEYSTYEFALECTGLQKLSERRENRCLKFGLQSLLHPVNNKMFPVNPQILENPHNTRNTEHFVVNKANSESYRKSAIPYIQRMLNNYVQKQKQSQNYVNDNHYF